MVRLRHSTTGVVVDVAEEKASRLYGFTPVEDEAPKPKQARAKRASSSATDDEK